MKYLPLLSWNKLATHTGTMWIVVGLGVTVLGVFLPSETPLAVRLFGCFVGLALVVLALRQLALAGEQRRQVREAADELRKLATDAEHAYAAVVKDFTNDAESSAAFLAFETKARATIERLLGAEQVALFDTAPKINAYGTGEFPGGQRHGALLVYRAWIEITRGRLLAGELRTTGGAVMPGI